MTTTLEGVELYPSLVLSAYPLTPDNISDAWGKLQGQSLALNFRLENEVLVWRTYCDG